MGTTLRVLDESYPMNTNIKGFRCLFNNRCVLVLWTKVAAALHGLRQRWVLLSHSWEILPDCWCKTETVRILELRGSPDKVQAHVSCLREIFFSCTLFDFFHNPGNA